MSLVMKTGKFAFLEKIGVSKPSIAKLKALGVKMALGSHEIEFFSAGNEQLVTAVLSTEASEFVKGTAKNADVEVAKAAVEAAIISIGKSADKTVLSALVSPEADVPNKTPKPKTGDIVLLRDAKSMYERVKGTSPNSVYVVVAMSPLVNVAARLKPASLSVRVEGKLSPAIVAAFGKSGISPSQNGLYMSGHFQCANVSPDRVMGAVLLDTGLEFTTPLPLMAKVAKLCS